MQTDDFLTALRSQLANNLPGRLAQLKMAPRPLSILSALKFRKMNPNPDSRKGAVLILIHPQAGELGFPLILRTEYEGVHSGQPALPGGKFEAEDQELEVTATRETGEEIGIPTDRVELLGSLTPIYIQPSDFHVTPFVGYLPEEPQFVGEEKEVAGIYPTTLSMLLDKQQVAKKIDTRRNIKMSIPYYNFHGLEVWGATAMILSEFATLLRRTKLPR